jgi:dTDP-glucose pyrophosphorylase
MNTIIIIPMAGLSSRFFDAGYKEPKYKLKVGGYSLFHLSVYSFKRYFQSAKFIFVCRNVYETKNFIEHECHIMKIANFEIIELTKETSGQAETVALGLNETLVNTDDHLAIFNIDTIRPNILLPETKPEKNTSYLEVFKGKGTNWSFIKLNSDNTKVIEVSEKRRISNLCCTGLYYFSNISSFLFAYENPPKPVGAEEIKESYVAPLYNTLIKQEKDVGYRVVSIEDVIFSGVPEEYEYITSEFGIKNMKLKTGLSF